MENLIALLVHYKFDFSPSPEFDNFAQNVSQRWQLYSFDWVHLASVEAIYQGRYKIASIDYILKFWLRRGQPICRFTREFERLICADFAISAPNCGIYSEKLAQSHDSIPQKRQALQRMQLLAESSLFIDKLKSMSSYKQEDLNISTPTWAPPENVCDLAPILL